MRFAVMPVSSSWTAAQNNKVRSVVDGGISRTTHAFNLSMMHDKRTVARLIGT